MCSSDLGFLQQETCGGTMKTDWGKFRFAYYSRVDYNACILDGSWPTGSRLV